MRTISRGLFPALVLAFGLLAADATTLLAQGGGSVPSLRPYWHVFLAYAAAWLLILGWVVSIARRLGRIERTMENRESE
jgi:CcmD family protein